MNIFSSFGFSLLDVAPLPRFFGGALIEDFLHEDAVVDFSFPQPNVDYFFV